MVVRHAPLHLWCKLFCIYFKSFKGIIYIYIYIIQGKLIKIILLIKKLILFWYFDLIWSPTNSAIIFNLVIVFLLSLIPPIYLVKPYVCIINKPLLFIDTLLPSLISISIRYFFFSFTSASFIYTLTNFIPYYYVVYFKKCDLNQ